MLIRKDSHGLKSQVCVFQSSLKSAAVYTNPFPLRPVDRYWSTTACLLGNMNKIWNLLLHSSFIILSKSIYSSSLHESAQIRCLLKYIGAVSSSLAPVLAELLDIHLICDTIILMRCHAKSEEELTQPDLRVLTNFNFVQKLRNNDFFCWFQHILSIHSSTHLDNPYAKKCFRMQ